MADAFSKKISELGFNYHPSGQISQGDYNGYNVLIKNFKSTKRYLINFPIKSTILNHENEISNHLTSLFDDLKSKHKTIILSQFTPYKISIVVDYNGRLKFNGDELVKILNAVSAYLRNNSFVSCCDACGEQALGSINEINDFPHYFCLSCASEAKDYMDELKTNYEESPNNYLKGALGALLFSLIGVATFVIVAMMGKIAAISVAIMFIAITKGYEKFGGKLNFIGATINFIILIVMTIISNYAAVGFEVYKSMKEYGIGLLESFKNVPDLISTYPEIKEAFNHDLRISLLFAIPISLYLFYSAYKANNPNFKNKTY